MEIENNFRGERLSHILIFVLHRELLEKVPLQHPELYVNVEVILAQMTLYLEFLLVVLLLVWQDNQKELEELSSFSSHHVFHDIFTNFVGYKACNDFFYA